MNDIDITLHRNGYRVKALADALAAQTANPAEFAVYHIRENGEDSHFTSEYFKTPMQAAYRYRLYERGELSSEPEALAAAFIETNPIDLKKFTEACDNIHSDRRITALVEFDLDEGRVSVCDSGDHAWRTYALPDFSAAAYKAFQSDCRSEDCRREIFDSSLAGKEIDMDMTADKNAGMQAPSM